MDEDINGSLPHITASVARFDRLISALVDLSRTGRYPLHPVWVDAAEVLRSTLDTLHKPIEDAGAIVIVGQPAARVRRSHGAGPDLRESDRQCNEIRRRRLHAADRDRR